MTYNDSSKGIIINEKNELFSYNLDMNNFTFIKKNMILNKYLMNYIKLLIIILIHT